MTSQCGFDLQGGGVLEVRGQRDADEATTCNPVVTLRINTGRNIQKDYFRKASLMPSLLLHCPGAVFQPASH